MKEIDFIPEWYKAGRERKRRYIRQYTLLAVMFTLMVGWGFLINGHITHVNAEVQEIQTSFEKAKIRSEKVLDLEKRISELRQQAGLLDMIESRTKVTAILGELSYLVGENVILSELVLGNEPIQQPETNDKPGSAAVVRAADMQKGSYDEVISSSPSHCKVVLRGVAARPADAASLIARLEQAEYFCHVSLVYSKPKKIKDKNVTEFGISCFVADYEQVN